MRKQNVLVEKPAIPLGWRAVYRVLCFCETDDAEPKNEYGATDFDTYEEALAQVKWRRSRPASSRIEVILLSPTVLPFPSVIKRHAKSIAEYKGRMARGEIDEVAYA